MQRIIVDLPEPDGPQMTMRSPRIDRQVDVAQHVELAVPFVHADDLDGRRRRRGLTGGAACVGGHRAIACLSARVRLREPRSIARA